MKTNFSKTWKTMVLDSRFRGNDGVLRGNDSARRHASRKSRTARGAFTLIEIMVALAIMMLLLAIVFIPINLGLDVFHIGKVRSEVQQANQLVINQLAAELRQSVHVFPNEKMAGITTKAPYSYNSDQPYYQAGTPVSNTARLDFLLPKTDNGVALMPPRADNYIVTYYTRRLDPTMTYDNFSNPVVLFRAQYPYANDDGSASTVANLDSTRYNSANLALANGSSSWLTQNSNGEPNLESLCAYSASTVSANQLLATPQDMALIAPHAADATPNYQPDSSFSCNDANSDGVIDHVTISLLMGRYDSIGAQDKRQIIRLSQTVSLPNVK